MRQSEVRYREEGFELRCSYCLMWWPLDLECWYPAHGLRRCKSCWREYKAAREAGLRRDEIMRDLRNTANRLKYRANRERYLVKNREWRAANREKVAAYNKAYRERNREELNAKVRDYYKDAREVILLKKRQKYRDAA